MQKTILHLDLDTFFVSVERKLDSRLYRKPILVGGLSDRGVVAACSYETRGYGVHSGMPMKMARELGIAKSGFYCHFKDRDDLLGHILDY